MNRKSRRVRPLVLAHLAACALALPAAAQGSFTRVGDTIVGRNLCQVALLADGRVLVTGGTRTGESGTVFNREAEIYDPATQSFSATGPMSSPRIDHAVVTLQDGRVLVLGGTTNGTAALNSAEVFDPTAGAFKATASMGAPRDDPSATLLGDGRVLVAGGNFSQGEDIYFVVVAELYDPATDRFSISGRMQTPRIYHTAQRLPDGRVLIVGGLGQDPLGPNVIAVRDVEAFDPATGEFTVIGQLSEGRSRPQLTLLEDGKVLVSGGVGLDAQQNIVISSTLEVFDPAAGTSSTPVSMSMPRREHAAVALADGRVLLAGGTTTTGSTAAAELFDPAAGTTTPLGEMTEPRTQAGAIRLQDGSVLIVGGARLTSTGIAARLQTAEVYRP
jgi:hypothetical protein